MLYVVRHGRTAANASGLLLGHADPPLDELGRQQAAALAEHIGPVDRVVTSPLRRTRETADAFTVPATVDERIIEMDYGEWDETPARSIPPEVWDRWRSDLDFAPPGGESIRQVGIRVREACDAYADEAAERTVVLVTHVSPLKAAVAWGLGVADSAVWHMFVAPASRAKILTGPNGPVLMQFGIDVDVV